MKLPSDLERIVLRLCEDAGTPRAQTVFMMVRAGEMDQLFGLSVSPSDYDDLYHATTDKLRRDILVTDLLRKVDGLGNPKTMDDLCVENFFKSERECCQANRRLSPFLGEALIEVSDGHVLPVIDRARAFVRRVLGRLPDHLNGRFGPGATFLDKGGLTTIPDKIESRNSLGFTPSASLFFPFWEETWWARAHREVRGGKLSATPVRGNRFTTVPKDSRKRRGICVEPSLNLFYQLAVGDLLKRKLLRVGLDLRGGQAHHGRVARAASIDGLNATIDLSNASDTVAYNLVKLLLPEEWFALLETLRSPYTLVRGKWVRLEKFSSMGNGFTFELETLIFSAIIHGCTGLTAGTDFSVYGDDIIVPTSVGSLVVKALRFFGFTPNPSKTFLTGCFRESCGSDYFRGVPVRGHYLDVIPSHPADWISLANGLRRFAKAVTGSPEPWITRTWHMVLDQVPTNIRRLRGPEALGDLVIHDDEERWSVVWNRRYPCVRFIRCWRPVPARIAWAHWAPSVILASALYGCDSMGVIPRDPSLSYKVGFVPFS